MQPYYTQSTPPPPRGKGRTGLVVGITAVVLVALVVGVAGGYFLFKAHPNALNRVLNKNNSAHTLPGQVPAVAKSAHDTGALDPNMVLPLSISLPLRNQAALRGFLTQVNNPESPFYHQYLTPEQFHTRFSASDATVQSVKDYLSQSGLSVTGTSGSNQFVNVKGKVSDIESAFEVQLRTYTLNGQSYYGPANNPKVGSAFIQNISGLDNFSAYHRPQPNFTPSATSGFTPAQLQKAYNATGLLSKGIDGSGQNIAFLELSDFNASDVQAYQQQYSLTGGTFEKVSVDGGATLDAQGSVEVELDMEVAFAIAAKAHQYVYEGPNTGQGINDIYSQIVNDNKAKIVSISWGLCEQSSGSAELQALSQIFAQGASEGITFFAASGDSGAYDCGDTALGVDSPADDPNVTGVGGTSLTANADGTYGSEQAWSCSSAKCTQNAPNGEGGGGGVSANFPVPTFQSSLQPAGAQGQGRYVPDVSANADPQTGYAIVASGKSGVVGGTSAAAPLWAGGAALMSAALAKDNKSFGSANTALYGAAGTSGAFHDVAQGTNLHYNAGQGYDLATGLGTPDFTNLAQAIANGPTATPPPGGTPTPTPGGNPTPTPGGNPTPTPVPGGGTGTGQELLTNNSFENGKSPWAESSSGQFELVASSNDNQNQAVTHTGTYAAYLCGYKNCTDEIGQAFQIPSGATQLTLSYWWDMEASNTSGCNDKFTATIYTTTDDGSGNLTLGNSVAQAQSACNSDANGSYAQKTVDLSQLVSAQSGQTLAIIFTGTTGGSGTTRTFVDDVSIQAS